MTQPIRNWHLFNKDLQRDPSTQMRGFVFCFLAVLSHGKHKQPFIHSPDKDYFATGTSKNTCIRTLRLRWCPVVVSVFTSLKHCHAIARSDHGPRKTWYITSPFLCVLLKMQAWTVLPGIIEGISQVTVGIFKGIHWAIF